MSDMKDYELRLDGPAFRAQRELLLRLADLARRKRPWQPAPGDGELLEGLVALSDEIADQAHDRHEIDCLLHENDDEGDAHRKETGFCKTVHVPVEIAFTTDPAELDDRADEPAPTLRSLVEYLKNALRLDIDNEGCGQPEGAVFAGAGIDWDAAILVEGTAGE